MNSLPRDDIWFLLARPKTWDEERSGDGIESHRDALARTNNANRANLIAQPASQGDSAMCPLQPRPLPPHGGR